MSSATLPREQWDSVFIPVLSVRHKDSRIWVPVEFYDDHIGRLGRLLVIPTSECRYRSDKRWCVRASLLYDEIARWLQRLQQEGYEIQSIVLWPWTLLVKDHLTEAGFANICWQFASAH